MHKLNCLCRCSSPANLTSEKLLVKNTNSGMYKFIFLLLMISLGVNVYATNYVVSDKTTLQTRMNAALPGDTVIVANGTYNFGQIVFTNNNSISTSAWIVLKAETFRGVVFTGSTYLQFKGTRVVVDGFRFANGNAGTNAVISFRSSSSNLANYCRITNIIIDNYNTPSADSSLENEWVGIYGTNNRVDHCTFINKYNARATVVVWYSTTTYPAPAISTYHRIDSNYFAGRSYLGTNGGETIRVGDSNSSRTDGYNTVEYNLFEGCIQTEPEIISNKSDFNVYRYNTFKNNTGGLTLRHGRYCSVYSNFFIVNNASITGDYGIRVIDKGHKVFNNYLEGLNGNKNSLTSLRCPIILYNGLSSTNDTADAAKASGYFPADSTIVAFNTIVNASGGGGIVLGFTDAGANTFQPLGIMVSNNLIKMTTGQAAYLPPTNTLLTYSAEGNKYEAPNGLGLTSSTGFSGNTLTFGARANGILPPPSLVQDAAINTASYISLLNDKDVLLQTRSAVYDVGAQELNGSTIVIDAPLDSNLVGAGKPAFNPVPVHLLSFKALLVDKIVNLSWSVDNEINFKQYNVEFSNDGVSFTTIGIVNTTTNNNSHVDYNFKHPNPAKGNNYYRLKMVDIDGSFTYSAVRVINVDKGISVNVFPNPAQHFITIELSGTITSSTTIVLFNNEGKEVKRINNLSSNTINIPLEKLAVGMYYLQIIEKDKTCVNYPFLIR